MQREYFLGGASAQGFVTAFWQEQRGAYGIYLKGGPGTGKSTLMKRIAAAFAGEPVSLYHCASDPRSLDAVVLESRGVFIADATAPHEASTPLPFVTGETADLAAGLNADLLYAERDAVRGRYEANQNAHKQAKKGLAGVAEMQDIIAENGLAALDPEKLTKYASRLAKRLLPRNEGGNGVLRERQCTAVTPLGRLRLIPKDFDLICLHDPYFAAGEMLLSLLADAAVRAGQPCEVSRSLTRSGRPAETVIFPAQRTAAAIYTAVPAEEKGTVTVQMQRFYDGERLRRQRSLMRFCAKTAAAAEEQVIALLAEALRVHDALEEYYIAALDRDFLDAKAAELIERIKAI